MISQTTVINKYKGVYDVYIGRGSPWGNPYTHLPGKTKAQFLVATREEAVAKYQEYILGKPELLNQLSELEGKALGCFCAPKLCHGDTLVKLVAADARLRSIFGIQLDYAAPEALVLLVKELQ